MNWTGNAVKASAARACDRAENVAANAFAGDERQESVRCREGNFGRCSQVCGHSERRRFRSCGADQLSEAQRQLAGRAASLSLACERLESVICGGTSSAAEAAFTEHSRCEGAVFEASAPAAFLGATGAFLAAS
jgi:hypothetical protein